MKYKNIIQKNLIIKLTKNFTVDPGSIYPHFFPKTFRIHNLTTQEILIINNSYNLDIYYRKIQHQFI